MRSAIPLLAVLMWAAPPAQAAGLLVPADKQVPPLALVRHKVDVTLEDQVSLTTVEQTFRNHTDRPLEATYLFPVPRGASVDRFTMWVDGKETGGELLDAKKAHDVYTDIVRRTQDPGLLEYLGNDLMRLRVFPVPPRGDQKVKLSFKAIAHKDAGVIEYIYPLKTDGKDTRALEEFAVNVTIKSQHPIQNVYSPTHAVTITRKGEKEVRVEFARDQARLDKDFQLFYGIGAGDIGLTALMDKPVTSEDGYAMLLLSPQVNAEQARTPRDLVLVLDTSGSMSEVKLRQAKNGLKYCLAQLRPEDRFGIVRFSTSVETFRDDLTPANKDALERADKWVNDLRTGGGTAIWPALEKALALRTNDAARTFTVVFFTDGQPTVDETNPDKIVRNVADKNTGTTRIFTFGVGDDVNAAMLDRLADTTRAVSTYVRPAEDIEAKVASLYAKISHPVMTDVRLATGDNVKLHEMYPSKLPDLFHGTQLVILARYSGSGHTPIKLTGRVGGEKREFVYEMNFPARTEADTRKDFIEPLWARRKVGYLLDQIRVNGEQQELVNEVVTLAKKYGIATPYTSYLVVPDGPMPVVNPIRPRPLPGGPVPFPAPGAAGGFGAAPPALRPLSPAPGSEPRRLKDFAREQAAAKADPKAPGLAANRGTVADQQANEAAKQLKDEKDPARKAAQAGELRRYREQKELFDRANQAFKGRKDGFQSGKLGVDLALNTGQLRNQDRLSPTATQQANGRQVVEIGGVWIDDAFRGELPTVTVKAQSDAYFRILAKVPAMKDVYRLGNYVVWVTPSGTALVIDPNDGKDQLADAEIATLFVKK